MSVRFEVDYRGDVQGVGFRATAVHLSRDLDVHGFVKNMPDGSVKLVAEGEQADVNTLLDRVNDRLGRHIDDVDRHSRQPTGEKNGFHIG